MIPEFPVYLFDVDGTLVDSADDICGALQTVLSETPRPDVDPAFLKRYIGYHLNDLFGDLFPEMSAEGMEDLLCKYRSIYPARGHTKTRLYPGVLETLAVLPGRKSTATTKGYFNDTNHPRAVRPRGPLPPCAGDRWFSL